MPPWPASSNFGGPFRDARVMTDAEIATLQAWAEAKCPEGDPEGRARAPDVFFGLGAGRARPDAHDARALQPGRHGRATTFAFSCSRRICRRIAGFARSTSGRAIVRSCITSSRRVDPSGRGRELDAADPGPGYSDLGGFGDGVPITAFLPIWTPGAKSRYTASTERDTCCPKGPTS